MGLFISRALQYPERFWFFPSFSLKPRHVGIPVDLLFSWLHMATAIPRFISGQDNEATLPERKHLLNIPKLARIWNKFFSLSRTLIRRIGLLPWLR